MKPSHSPPLSRKPESPELDFIALFTALSRAVQPQSPIPPPSPEMNVQDLGLDSVSLMEVVGCLEDELEILLPNEDLEAVKTVADLERIVRRELSATPGAR